MNTERNQPSDNKNAQQNISTPSKGGPEEGDVQISQPDVERAEGPFEHSGETSGWTEEERKEKQDQE